MDYYNVLLGETEEHITLVNKDIVRAGNLLTQEHKDFLLAPYTHVEVNKAMFCIDENKAPSPNGFGSFFFKDTWGIVGEEVTKAILDFFQHGICREL